MGRFWQTLVLYNWSKYFSVIPLESIIRDKQQEYYRVLEECGACGESTLFIEFKLAAIVGISKRKIEENLAKLKEQSILQRAGGTRGHWNILVDI